MPWVYLDDRFPEHVKVERAGGDAAWLFIAGLCYVNRNLTGGTIPKTAVARLTDRRSPLRLAGRLVEVGLWEDEGDDFRIHDYEHQNRSAMARREKAKKAATARWSGSSEDAPSNTRGNPPSNATGNAQPMPPVRAGARAPSPSPSPLLTSPSSSSSVEGEHLDDDEISLRREAETRLALRQAERGPVGNPEAWLAKATETLRHERRAKRVERQRIEGCPDCSGRGIVEQDDGSVLQCFHDRVSA